ncbi:hypothetical protein ACIQFP_09415 [Nocardiopsis alba]|uniref:hypothetical protein n=1 Tax=Nocardiopsis alba TaxID=53437 RepID=UPI0033D9905C
MGSEDRFEEVRRLENRAGGEILVRVTQFQKVPVTSRRAHSVTGDVDDDRFVIVGVLELLFFSKPVQAVYRDRPLLSYRFEYPVRPQSRAEPPSLDLLHLRSDTGTEFR